LPRPRDPASSDEHIANRKTMTFKDRTKSWLPSTPALRDGPLRKLTEKSTEEQQPGTSQGSRRDWGLSIDMPPHETFTVAQNPTPGWDSPWTARPTAQGPFRDHERENSYGLDAPVHDDSSDTSGKKDSWATRKKRLRIFLLNNAYVPLVSTADSLHA